MLWDQDNVLKFIDLYHTRLILWDPKHKHRYNRKLKHEAWVEISNLMNCSIADLKKKLESLQAQLRREKSQMRKSAAQDPDEEYISTWYAYDHLKFLMDRNNRSRMKTKKLQDNENSTTSTEQSEDEQFETVEIENADLVKMEFQPQEDVTENFEYVHTSMEQNAPISQNEVEQPIFKQPSTKRRKVNYSDARMMNTAFEMRSPATVNEGSTRNFASTTPNDSEAYANFIASKFRTYSLRTKNALQYQISNLLYKADNGYFEHSQPSFASSSQRSIKTVESTSQTPSQSEQRCQRTSSAIVNESRNKLDSPGAPLSNDEERTQN